MDIIIMLEQCILTNELYSVVTIHESIIATTVAVVKHIMKKAHGVHILTIAIYSVIV